MRHAYKLQLLFLRSDTHAACTFSNFRYGRGKDRITAGNMKWMSRYSSSMKVTSTGWMTGGRFLTGASILFVITSVYLWCRRRSVKLTILHLVLRSRMRVELYLHFPIRLYGIVLNKCRDCLPGYELVRWSGLKSVKWPMYDPSIRTSLSS
jgi:hypothetical protein